MKKLVLFFAVAVAVAFASCGSKPKTEDAPEAVKPTEVAAKPDSVKADSAAKAAQAAQAAPAAAPAK
jgi:outer membrane murein-binding lipoprotein Lpp